MSRIALVRGTALPLRGDDVDTDRIIPARYLKAVTFEGLGEHAFEDDRKALAGAHPFDDARFASATILVVNRNFGCGSSREHAPWALAANGIRLVVAESFARIFRQNMFNCGLLAVELPAATIDRLFQEFPQGESTAEADVARSVITFRAGRRTEEIPFTLAAFDRALVESGGWLEYADRRY